MMRLRSRLALASFAVILLCGTAFGASKCAVSDFRVVAQNEIHLYCSVRVHLPADTHLNIYQLDAEGQRIGAIKGDLFSTTQSHWYQVKLASPLTAGSQYQVKDTAKIGDPVFDLYTFTTTPSGKLQVIDTPSCRNGHLVILQSRIALDATSLRSANLAVKDAGTQTIDFQRSTNQVPDDRLIGQATACASFRSQPGQTVDLILSGPADIFSGAVKASGSYAAPPLPLTPTSATFYAKFDGQAGVGQKPGYTIEASASPTLTNLTGQYYLLFSGNADLGFGTSDTTHVTDMIKLGLGVTRYYARPRIEFEPLLQYETDRHGTHPNLLLDAEAQYFGRNWRRSIAQRNYDEYARQVLTGGDNAPTDPSEVNKFHSGLLFETHLGAELGRSLTTESVNSSDATTTVVLPTYDIARIKPRVNLTAEYQRVSLTAAVTPRYLFTHENVTREVTIPNPSALGSTIQSIYVTRRNGLRTIGELTFLWALDAPGHFSWSVTYKVGSEPPNFNHINQVETGLVLIY